MTVQSAITGTGVLTSVAFALKNFYKKLRRQKMSEKRTIFQQRMRVLNKLYNYGCKTEKDLQKLTLENILEINGITIPEMSVITELQKQVKAGTLYSYLGGGENEQSY